MFTLVIMGVIYFVSPGGLFSSRLNTKANQASPTASITPSPSPTATPLSNLAGTTWNCDDEKNNRFALRFLAGGNLEYYSGGPPDKSLRNTWKIEGEKILFELDKQTLMGRGVRDGNRIEFDFNKGGTKWTSTCNLW